jgi:hypothetical protein
MVFADGLPAAGTETIAIPNVPGTGLLEDPAPERETEPWEIQRQIPIRVLAFDPGRVEFCEGAVTYSVSPNGATIGLRHCVVMGDFLRIVNLENLNEADFRIVGPQNTVALRNLRMGAGMRGAEEKYLGFTPI